MPNRRIGAPALACVLGLCTPCMAEEPDKKIDEHPVFVDLATGHFIGLGAGTWNVLGRNARVDHDAGSIQLERGGELLGAGMGIRTGFSLPHALWAQVGLAGGGAQATGVPVLAAPSTAFWVQLRAGFGVHYAIGPLVLHTATTLGFSLDTISLPGWHPPVDKVSANLDSSTEYSMERWSFRLGQEVGAHMRLGSTFTLFGAFTLDYDSRWTAQVGLGLALPGNSTAAKPVAPAQAETPRPRRRVEVQTDGDAAVNVRVQPTEDVDVVVHAGGNAAVNVYSGAEPVTLKAVVRGHVFEEETPDVRSIDRVPDAPVLLGCDDDAIYRRAPDVGWALGHECARRWAASVMREPPAVSNPDSPATYYRERAPGEEPLQVSPRSSTDVRERKIHTPFDTDAR